MNWEFNFFLKTRWNILPFHSYGVSQHKVCVTAISWIATPTNQKWLLHVSHSASNHLLVTSTLKDRKAAPCCDDDAVCRLTSSFWITKGWFFSALKLLPTEKNYKGKLYLWYNFVGQTNFTITASEKIGWTWYTHAALQWSMLVYC